jgi:hypothetical protein
MPFVIQSTRSSAMKVLMSVVAISTALIASDASAQGVNLSGRWQCVALCLGPVGSFAFITQYGWELNVVNDAGEPSRAWVNYPGRIWVDRANQGAIYSPDGITLQFDRGTIWQRAPEPLPPPPPRRK